jgi:hypothetical protein
LTDKQIVFGKVIGSALQGWAFWLLLAVHILVFSIAGYINIFAVIPLIALAVCSVILVSAIGVFFSSLFKRGSVSSALNLIAILGLNFPFCCPVPFFLVNPIFVAIGILAVTGGWSDDFHFSRAGSGWYEAFLTSGFALFILLVVYLLFAFAASKLAIRKIRRRIF